MPESTLLVADDHPLFRAAVIHVLREALPQFAVLEAASAATLGAALQQHPEIELVLLDLAMPGARGFSALLCFGTILVVYFLICWPTKRLGERLEARLGRRAKA